MGRGLRRVVGRPSEQGGSGPALSRWLRQFCRRRALLQLSDQNAYAEPLDRPSLRARVAGFSEVSEKQGSRLVLALRRCERRTRELDREVLSVPKSAPGKAKLKIKQRLKFLHLGILNISTRRKKGESAPAGSRMWIIRRRALPVVPQNLIR